MKLPLPRSKSPWIWNDKALSNTVPLKIRRKVLLLEAGRHVAVVRLVLADVEDVAELREPFEVQRVVPAVGDEELTVLEPRRGPGRIPIEQARARYAASPISSAW